MFSPWEPCLPADAHGYTLVHYDHSSRIMKVQLHADLNACIPTFRGDMFFRTRDDKGPKGSIRIVTYT